jgi:hypothetical protein
MTENKPIVYTISKAYKIAASIIVPIFIILFGLMAFYPLFSKISEDLFVTIFTAVVGFLGFIGFPIFLVNIFKRRIEIYYNLICDINLFTRKELKFNEIIGYRIVKYKQSEIIELIPGNPEHKKFSFASNLNDNEGFRKWVDAKFKRID